MGRRNNEDFWSRVERRHALLTTADGIAEFGRKGFERRVKDGQFIRLLRGIYRAAGSPATALQTLLALTWALKGFASHRSALFLHGVPGFSLNRFEVTRFGASHFTRKLGVRVRAHRSNLVPAHHLTTIDGIEVTTLARTLCDMSAVMSLSRLERLVDTCKRLRLIEYADLAACREELRAQGRRRTTVLDQILEARIGGWIIGESPPEDTVRNWLVAAGFEPVSQHWTIANGRRRRLDIALPNDRIAVEYQGVDAHATATAVIDDSEKITELQLAGWFVVLVTKKTTRSELIRQVREAIKRQPGAA